MNRMIKRLRSNGNGLGDVSFFTALLTALLFACAVFGGENSIRVFSDLNGKPIGILVGTIFDVAAEKHIDYANIVYYDVYSEMEDDLVSGEIDAIIGDSVVIAQIAAKHPGLRALDENLEESDFGLALRYGDNKLFDKVNAALGSMKADGSLDALVHKWLDGPEEGKAMPPPDPGESGGGDELVLRVGTCSVWPPFTYKGPDGAVVGLDIEMVLRIGKAIGRRVEIVDMEFGELIPGLISAEVDMLAASLTVTPERKRVVRFTDGYFTTGITALVRDD